jgi:prolyl oligopeptidase
VLYTAVHPRECASAAGSETRSKDGTVALSGLAVSDNGKLAYSISRSGSDWQEWRVRYRHRAGPPDLVSWSKFSSAAWSSDDGGFYYQRFAEPKSSDQSSPAQTTTPSSTITAWAGRNPTISSSTSGPITRIGISRA